jgi:nickel-dependent lactate racemase
MISTAQRVTDILPALGTHSPMTSEQIHEMFEGVPESLFRIHNWRTGMTQVGEVPASFVKEVSEGAVDFPWPAQVANLLATGGHDLVLSIGQVVPHEVIGMANYNKNIFVGTGGAEGINKSHFIGAAYGMERMMGRANTPVRRDPQLRRRAISRSTCPSSIFTRSWDATPTASSSSAVSSSATMTRSSTRPPCSPCRSTFQMLDKPLDRVVAYLDPGEFKSTWLGNKAIYRTRMAMADRGQLIILAPGLREFGEDHEIDRLIRKYGYKGTPRTLEATKPTRNCSNNLSAAAHLIHGSSEGRFDITYCPGHLSREEIEGVGFAYADLAEMTRRYDPAKPQGRLEHPARRRNLLLYIQPRPRPLGLPRPLHRVS